MNLKKSLTIEGVLHYAFFSFLLPQLKFKHYNLH